LTKSAKKKRQNYRKARRRREERELARDAAPPPPPPVLKAAPKDDGPPRPYHDARHALYAYRRYPTGDPLERGDHESGTEVVGGARWDLGPISVAGIDDHPLMAALREAVAVLAAMPAVKRPVLALSRMEVLHDFNDAYGYTPEPPRPAVPSAAAITRADHTLLLFALMRDRAEERRALWLRALDHSYRHIADRMGLGGGSVYIKHRAARRLCEDGLWSWTRLIREAERRELERARRPFVAACLHRAASRYRFP
jgi:hypothetical protein